ncbi:pectinesterase-like [Camellia sinensis]|nr:pectinesterase-like [Camellia sinensis]
MLDQTLYELGQAIDDLRRFPASIGYLPRSYGNLKTLLSAAMTNENTCIDGFSDLEEYDLKGQKGLKEYLQGLLDPISHMISNCLAMIKYMETINPQAISKNVPMLINNVPEDEFPLAWMTTGHRRMMERGRRVRPHVVVSSDGIGKHRTIGEAVRMAPNMSLNRYVIRIKAGKYTENVVIHREKVNIILVGDGMNSTVITSSKNFIDGFSTFTSATLTVVGDKFIATDLTIMNTAGPQKHQAVALRVNSNAAFYRCNIISYQDTLYAHSLQQFYRECTIQGTIDFIFGNAAAIFQNCLIQVRKPILGQENMITAQGREDPNQNTGISLQNCTIVAAPDLTVAERANFSTFLGRPWRNYSRTIVMKSYLGDLIHPEGWHKWNEYSTLDTVEYTEYMNSGPGSDTRQRVTWAGYKKNCSEDVARQFTVGSFLHGADDWLESTGFPLSNGP